MARHYTPGQTDQIANIRLIAGLSMLVVGATFACIAPSVDAMFSLGFLGVLLVCGASEIAKRFDRSGLFRQHPEEISWPTLIAYAAGWAIGGLIRTFLLA